MAQNSIHKRAKQCYNARMSRYRYKNLDDEGVPLVDMEATETQDDAVAFGSRFQLKRLAET